MARSVALVKARVFFAAGFISACMRLAFPSAASALPCVECHREQSPALVMEWERSLHAELDIGCEDCHRAEPGEVDAWRHAGAWISVLVTPLDCARCHPAEVEQFSRSGHAGGADLREGPGSVSATGERDFDRTALNPIVCWRCHGSPVSFERNDRGEVRRSRDAEDGKPIIHPQTWPNSGIGRLNPDGSRGSCHACHARHAYDAAQSRSPESCGACHRGPAHPQIEIFNGSRHGISFQMSRDEMALDREDHWVLGLDYSTAPTCQTCHFSSYLVPYGAVVGLTHDVGERLSWDLLSPVSRKRNLVIYEDGFGEDYPETRKLPELGDRVESVETYVLDGRIATRSVLRTVKRIDTWEERRDRMKGVCVNCHGRAFTDAVFVQLDGLVLTYNERFGAPAEALMDELAADGVLTPGFPFELRVEWVFWKLWHEDAPRARHGAAMLAMDVDQGMQAAADRFYSEFLPAVVEAAATEGTDLEVKYEQKVRDLLASAEWPFIGYASTGSTEVVR